MTSITGGGVFQKTGLGTWDLIMPPGNVTSTTMAMAAGGLIDVEGGELRLGWGIYQNWTNNQASLNVAAGGLFECNGTAPRSMSTASTAREQVQQNAR